MHDLKTALSDGQTQVKSLLQERVFTKINHLTATIHKNKRRNITSEQIRAPLGAPMKVAQMKKAGLAEGTGMVPLQSALERRVTEECLSLYNVDGSMRMTAKIKLLELFNLDPVAENPLNLSLVDRRLIWRLAILTPKYREAKKWACSEYNWSDYLDKLCAIILSHHADAYLVTLVNDKYDIPFIKKDDERDRREAKHPHITNVF